MKSIIRVFIGILLLGSFITSCDEEKEDANFFKVANDEYQISYGLLENWGRQVDGLAGDNWDFDGYNVDLTFCTDGIGIYEGEYEVEHTGTGQMLYFELLNPNGTSLENGNYIFDENSTPSPVKTFDFASYSTNYDDNKADNDWITIASGKITVNRSGSQYVITVDCIDEYGAKVTGSYKGALNYYDYVAGLRSAELVQKKEKGL